MTPSNANQRLAATDRDSWFIPRAGRRDGVSELHRRLPARHKRLLADLAGPGVIRHLVMTHANHAEDTAILASRGVIVRAWWDGEQTPSVEAPLGDLFGIGFGKDRRLISAIWMRDGNRSLNLYVPMPFRKRARIELENLTDCDLEGFYWWIDYDADVPLPRDLEYFHAHYRQSHPVPKNASHPVLEAEGHGKLIALLWSVNWLGKGCAPENAFNLFVDGRPVQGMNSEDYFGQAWGFRPDPFNTPWVGQSLAMEDSGIGSTHMSSYRIHLPDPVLFQKSLRFTLDNQGWLQGYRTDSYDTLAFWYQSHPHRPLPPLPPMEDLLPVGHPASFARGQWAIHQREKARDPAAALARAETLLQRYPSNPKAPDVWFKIGNLRKQLGQIQTARQWFRSLRRRWPKSDAAADASDQLWLLDKPGRLLLTLVSPSGWTADLDGKQVAVDPAAFRSVPPWAERVHYRYGRRHVYRSDAPGVVADAPPAENRLQWKGTASSIMRLFTLRLEPGTGNHDLTVAARSSTTVPIQLESPAAPAFLACVALVAGPDVVSDATWQVADKPAGARSRPSPTAAPWKRATAHPNDQFGDAAWFWLQPAGFRKFPGHFRRLWDKDPQATDKVLWFRKTLVVP